MMDADEREVYLYLRSNPEQFVPANTICRHAGGKHRFRESPDWAKPVVLRMVERGILEMDSAGSYRLRPRPPVEATAKRWVSPQIAAILQQSGRKFDHLIKDDEAYYDSL